jgi:diguanylate cyclase (GGDEF)-like protein/PAS domain S-box-containing protein
MERTQEATVVSGIVEVDVTVPDHPVTYVSPGFERLTGYAASEVLGRNCRLLQGPDTDPRTVAVLSDAIRAGREADVTILNYRADGTPFWNELTIAPQHGPDGRVVRYLGVQKDVTERIAAGARIHRLAHFDTLTGLPNRATLQHELRGALQRARARDHEVALLSIDLDDFKRVNDSRGHHTGDVLLREVARRLAGVVRPSDVLARQGGDEFLLLVPDVAADAPRVATDLAGRVLSALREPVMIDGLALTVRASVGVSTMPRDARTADELLRHADMAMYLAKRGGKDAFHVHRRRDPAAHAGAAETFDPAAHAGVLERAIGGELRTLYQPIVGSPTGASWPTRRWRAGRRARRSSVRTGCSPPRRPWAGRSSWTGPAGPPPSRARSRQGRAAAPPSSSTASRPPWARPARPSTPPSGTGPGGSSTW